VQVNYSEGGERTYFIITSQASNKTQHINIIGRGFAGSIFCLYGTPHTSNTIQLHLPLINQKRVYIASGLPSSAFSD